VRVLVIGELTVVGDDGRPIAVAGVKERLLLAILTAASPAVVSVDRLVELLWDGEPPTTARKSLQVHVVHLRSALEPGRPRGSPGRYVARRGDGYVLVVERDAVDAHRFYDLVARGRAVLTAGDPDAVVRQLTEALRLWRGPPYVDWPDADFAVAERHRLGEVRSAATAGLIEARLALGQHADVIPELERLVSEEPLREGWWRLLMLALYRDGRQADALVAARRVRSVLAEEVGADPGPALREVERAVLAHDPMLDLPTQRVPPSPSAVPATPSAGEALPPDEPTGGSSRDNCPWLGLSSYQRDDAALFRGRRRLVAQMLGRLADTRVMVVSGPSGAGKSSLVRAGLVPALADGGLPGSGGWQMVVVTPGRDAVDALADLAGEVPPDRPVLLVCDQAEELWSPGYDRVETTAFLDATLELVASAVVARCVLVVRGDHLGRLAEHTGFAGAAAAGLLLVPPMTDPELREVVQEPAATVGLQVEPELVEAVVADVVGRAGALPLLSTALVGTWERRRRGLLTLGGYLQAGGVGGALVRTAEAAFESLSADGRDAARRVLVRLADSDRPGVMVRRQVPLRELDLAGDGGPARVDVVEGFVRRRLLTVDGDRVEVTHEVLLTAWPRLVRWLEDDAVGRAVRRHLAPAATEWERAGEPVDELYRGARLAAALDWLAAPGADPTTLERRFLAASKEHSDAELLAARRRAEREAATGRRTRRLAVGLAAALVVALATAGVAVGFQQAAEDRTVEAEAARADAEAAQVVAEGNRLAALSSTVRQLDVSLLLAVQAVRLTQTTETEDALLAALAAHSRAVRVVPFDGLAQNMFVTADGGTVLVFVGDGSVGWSVGATTQPRRIIELSDEWAGYETGTASRTGGLFTAGGWGWHDEDVPWLRSDDIDGVRTMLLLGEQVGGLPLAMGYGTDDVLRVVLTGPDGSAEAASWWVAELDRAEEVLRPTGITGPMPLGDVRVSVSPDGESGLFWSESGSGPATRVDLVTGTAVPVELGALHERVVVRLLPGGGYALHFDTGRVDLRDADGNELQLLDDPTQPVWALAASADGTWAATSGPSGDILLWSVGDDGRWAPRETLTGHDGAVVGLAVSDDDLLFSASRDGTIVVWAVGDDGGFGHAQPGLHSRWVSNRPQVVAPGSLVVAPTRPLSRVSDEPQGSAEDTLRVAATFIDPATGEVVDQVDLADTVEDVTFGSSVSVSPDQRHVAVTSGLATTVVDTRTREVVETFELPPTGDLGPFGEVLPAQLVWCAGWTPDGSRLLIGAARGPDGGDDGELVVVDTATWEIDQEVPLGISPQNIEASPDGEVIVVLSSASSELAVLDAMTLEVLLRVPVADRDLMSDQSFSPDGSLLAAGGDQGLVHLFDTATWQLTHEPLRAHDEGLVQVEWTDDGSTVVSSSLDGTVSLLEPERGLVRSSRLRASTDPRPGYSFVVPGISDELVVLAGERPGRRYSMRPADWIGDACAVVGRDLSEAEWARYVSERPWEPTCSDLS
jgi:DNA-binding SARP family transcriptional activator/WD40 repeat protein